MLMSWETSARYMLKRTRFTLSVPVYANMQPAKLRATYNPISRCIDISGKYVFPQQNLQQHIIYDTHLLECNNEEHAVSRILAERELAKNAESVVWFSECCPKK